jgi:hypothetical protein
LLLFIVARTRLDRFEELRQYFAGWRDVRIVLDRREGERREPHDTCVGVEAAGRTTPPSRALLEEARLVRGGYGRTRLVTVSLLADLEEFIHNHHSHGPLTADATEPAWNGYLLTVACPCGVVFERWVTPEDADADLIGIARRN